MTNAQFSEQELDRRARQHAAQNRVSYFEGLKAVVGQAERTHAASAPSVGDAANFSEAQLDAAATAYARIHSVSYAEALRPAHAALSAKPAASSAPALPATSAARALESQAIEIFRAGSHVDDSGKALVFTQQDVANMAEVYSAVLHEAPIVIGHPADNGPAYGWVRSLEAPGDGRLLMRVRDVEPAFAEALHARRFTKRSASFYGPAAPHNPSPGRWYLRHVGWLGAHPPAIKGLADVSFAAAASGAVTFDITSV